MAKVKTRWYILDNYCGGHLTSGYAVYSEEEALEILKNKKEINAPHEGIIIMKQTKKWYERHWATVEEISWNL